MDLREVPRAVTTDGALRVHRDGTFATLGFVSHTRANLLAYIDDAQYLDALRANAHVSCVLTTEALADAVERAVATRESGAIGVAVVADPKRTFWALHSHLATATTFYGTPRPTVIADSAVVHPRATIADHDVEIGESVVIEPNVVIWPGVSIGAGSVIRAGVVIGADGFQVRTDAASVMRVPHAGRVSIGERVDIHANSCVDRAVFGTTSIGDDTTIDHFVYIAHDATIGARCRIVAHAAICGSVQIGDDAWIGPSSSIANGISVGARAWVSIGAVVTRDVASGQQVSGNFAIDHQRYLEFLRTIR